MSDNLPEPPMIVLAKCGDDMLWMRYADDGHFESVDEAECGWRCYKASGEMEVVPHPRNDERAVAIINGAKGAKP